MLYMNSGMSSCTSGRTQASRCAFSPHIRGSHTDPYKPDLVR